MALSNTWSFTVVRDDIIRESMLNIGAIGESEVPTAQEVTDCARKLNMMVKSWMGFQDFAPGLKMWERQRGTLFMTTTKGTYVLGGSNSDHWAGGYPGAAPGATYIQTSLNNNANVSATNLIVASTSNMFIGDFIGVETSTDIYWTTISNVNSATSLTVPAITSDLSSGSIVWTYSNTAQRPLAIVSAVLRDSSGEDIPLSVMTLQDYEILPNKTQFGYVADPTAFYYESQFIVGSSNTSNQGGGHLYLDMNGAQDTTKNLHIVYMRPVMDMNNPGDNPEYPQQWYRALCWGLSKEICGMFDATWTQDMEDNKKEAIAFAKEADSETTSLYFQPYALDPWST